jgi:hypothetical protein
MGSDRECSGGNEILNTGKKPTNQLLIDWQALIDFEV